MSAAVKGTGWARVWAAAASLRLAVVVMVLLAATCTVATFYESAHGTAAAQRAFYGTVWFAALLALLGVNVFASMMKRYPWRSHHAGFVIAHLGILALLAGSVVSLRFGLDSNMALYEGDSTDRVELAGQSLDVSLAEPRIDATFAVEPGSRASREAAARFPIPGTDLTLVVDELLAHAAVSESFAPARAGVAAVHVVVAGPMAGQDTWLAADGARDRVDLGPLSLALEVPATQAAVQAAEYRSAGRHELRLVLRPDATLAAVVFTPAGARAPQVVAEGGRVETPWMGMTVTVDRVLAQASLVRDVAPGQPAKDGRRLPAARVRLERAGVKTAPQWLLWNESWDVPVAGTVARVAYRAPQRAVPFRVTLLRFNSDKYPGSSMAATYESWVRVDDPERGVSEHHISMNNPLHYRGYIFFQASFVEGQPMMSIFSVTRAPGLPLVYLGVLLVSLGVAWMFYLKPALARRQGVRALAALAAQR